MQVVLDVVAHVADALVLLRQGAVVLLLQVDLLFQVGVLDLQPDPLGHAPDGAVKGGVRHQAGGAGQQQKEHPPPVDALGPHLQPSGQQDELAHGIAAEDQPVLPGDAVFVAVQEEGDDPQHHGVECEVQRVDTDLKEDGLRPDAVGGGVLPHEQGGQDLRDGHGHHLRCHRQQHPVPGIPVEDQLRQQHHEHGGAQHPDGAGVGGQLRNDEVEQQAEGVGGDGHGHGVAAGQHGVEKDAPHGVNEDVEKKRHNGREELGLQG